MRVYIYLNSRTNQVPQHPATGGQAVMAKAARLRNVARDLRAKGRLTACASELKAKLAWAFSHERSQVSPKAMFFCAGRLVLCATKYNIER